MTRSPARSAARLLSLGLMVACEGEPTTPSALGVGPEVVAAVTDDRLATLRVSPDSQMVFAGDVFRVVALPRNRAGELLERSITWTVGNTKVIRILGTTEADMPFRALKAGRTSARASTDGKTRTSIVVVRGVSGAKVVVTPSEVTIESGGSARFSAQGLTALDEPAGVNVTWTTDAGSISADGVLAATAPPGSYRVIATSLFGAADTAAVTIAGGEPPMIERVSLVPVVAASRPGEVTRFQATVWNTAGAQVAEPVAYEASCGSVTATGAYTAPGGGGTCLLMATAGDKADTTEVLLLRNTLEQGIPFGSYNMWPTATRTQSSGVAAFTGSHDYVPPGEMVAHLDAARARGMSIVLAMTGGSHDRYKTDGVFDQGKWEAAMDGYDTPAIRDAIAAAVADGTVIGNSVMDEPQQSGTTAKDWGPPGTMTKSRVDQLCGYVKAVFPTLPVGVGHDHNAFEPSNSYAVCEFLMPQYAARKGSVTVWRDGALAMAQRDGLAIVFSMNLLNGGVQDKTGAWDCPGTGGLGDRSPNCRMTATQVRDFGLALGTAGCAMLTWKYDSEFVARPDNQEAFSTIAAALAALPRPRCAVR